MEKIKLSDLESTLDLFDPAEFGIADVDLFSDYQTPEEKAMWTKPSVPERIQ